MRFHLYVWAGIKVPLLTVKQLLMKQFVIIVLIGGAECEKRGETGKMSRNEIN
jgi:hypothetical protein